MKRVAAFLMVLLGSIFMLLLLSTLGTVSFSLPEVLVILRDRPDTVRANLYMNLRLPRVLIAFFIGAALAVSGEGLQLTLKNPLADPYIIGISAGASFGAVFSLFLREVARVSISLELLALVFAVLAAFLTYYISRRGGTASVTSLILSGVIISFLFNAAVTFLVVFAWRNIITLHFWSLGSLSATSWDDVLKFMPFAVVQFIAFTILRRKMIIMAAGEEHAITVGLNPERIKASVFFLVALTASIAVSIAGLIGFVGLVIPHIVRMIFGVDSRAGLLANSLVGGAFLMVCDTVARTLFQPTELPIGAITALIGAPVFIYLLRRKEVVGSG